MQRRKENIMARKSMPFPQYDFFKQTKFIQFSVSLKMFYTAALVVFFRAFFRVCLLSPIFALAVHSATAAKYG